MANHLSYHPYFKFVQDYRKGLHLFGVVLLHLRQPLGPPPEADDLVLGAVGHVDQLLEEPPIRDGARDVPNDQPVLADLDERDARRRVFAVMHDEGLSTHLTRRHRLQVDVVRLLHTKVK